MNYRNRGERCVHGFLKGVIACPGCGEKRKRGSKYIPSEATAVTRSLGGPRRSVKREPAR